MSIAANLHLWLIKNQEVENQVYLFLLLSTHFHISIHIGLYMVTAPFKIYVNKNYEIGSTTENIHFISR